MKRALAGVFFVAALIFLMAWGRFSAPLTQEQQQRDDDLANGINIPHAHYHPLDDEIDKTMKRSLEDGVRDAVRVR
jgi:hypothetical protein